MDIGVDNILLMISCPLNSTVNLIELSGRTWNRLVYMDLTGSRMHLD